MVICHCRAVNDQSINACIVAGASSPDEIAIMCGAGDACGGCRPALRELLEQRVATAA
jgi:bacterioferritin-associated ferredoxin